MGSVKEVVLNPRAPEFKPTTSNASPQPQPQPQPTRAALYVPQQTVVYYHHHHHHHNLLPPFYYNYNYCKQQYIDYPIKVGDEMSTPSPTSPLPPPLPLPLPHQHHFRNISLKPNSSTTRINSNVKRANPQTRLKLKWVKKKQPEAMPETTPTVKEEEEEAVGAVPIASYPFGDSTSLMIRNIPVRLSRSELMEMLDAHCRSQNETLSPSKPASQFDFLYLPIDFKRKGNLGYAFVNFTTWEAASRLYNCWRDTSWRMSSYNTSKICQIYPAKFQGDELKKHFNKSVFECESHEFLPIHLAPPRDGFNAHLTRISTVGRWVRRPTCPALPSA